MLQPLLNCCCSVSISSFFLLTCIKTTRNELARLGMGTIFLVINKRIQHFFVREASSPCNGNHFLVGERAKRARRYLVMFMETRDIIYM